MEISGEELAKRSRDFNYSKFNREQMPKNLRILREDKERRGKESQRILGDASHESAGYVHAKTVGRKYFYAK